MEAREGLVLRFEGGRLLVLAARPGSAGAGRAAVYTVAGDRLIRSGRAGAGDKEIAIPLHGLASGHYVLEVAGAGRRWTRSFRLAP
jgi:hypothetical protein